MAPTGGMVDDLAEPIWFERSLALADARESGALLAYAMNGAPLPIRHGAPLRVIVPGWYAVASVKWLTGIKVTSAAFDGYFQADHAALRPAALRPAALRRAAFRPAAAWTAAVLAGAMLLAACGGGAQQSNGTASPASHNSRPPAPAKSHRHAARRPAVIAVTKAGALVILASASGSVAKTLVPARVIGGEIAVGADRTTVYFAVSHGCTDEVESVPVTGGRPRHIAVGSRPAISPDGTKLAFAQEPSLTAGCIPKQAGLTSRFRLIVRTLSSGDQVAYPMAAPGQDSGLPAPISHLSWAPDGARLAVSISAVQDNEGWNLVLLDTAAAQYYLSGPGDTPVPVTGKPSARKSYLREGVFMPDGNLFVSRACCAGVPVRNTSRLMWEVTTSGALVHQVAIGFANLDHVSLDASANGKWLLYLAGDILYVSHHGNTPKQLATGVIAAAWQ